MFGSMIYLDPIYRLSLKVQVQAQRRKDVPFSAESESEIGQTSSGNVAERADLIGNCKQVTSAAQRWVRPRVTASLAMLKFLSGSSTAGVIARIPGMRAKLRTVRNVAMEMGGGRNLACSK